jgi:hypothetical protein
LRNRYSLVYPLSVTTGAGPSSASPDSWTTLIYDNASTKAVPKGKSMSKNWQIVTKRERERAVELKRTQKRERKRAAAAEKAAKKNGTWVPMASEDDTEPEENDAVAETAETGTVVADG